MACMAVKRRDFGGQKILSTNTNKKVNALTRLIVETGSHLRGIETKMADGSVWVMEERAF